LVSVAVPLVTDPAAWTATSFTSAADYTISLDDTQRDEILAALHDIERRGRLAFPTKLTGSDFPLQELGPRLAQAFAAVSAGKMEANWACVLVAALTAAWPMFTVPSPAM